MKHITPIGDAAVQFIAATPGRNHPVAGSTPLAIDTWYHVAASYDGNKWQLFVNL